MSESGIPTGIPVPAWAERVADSLGPGPHVVVSGISVSGNIHAGNLREVLVAEAVANALRPRGEEVRFILHADTSFWLRSRGCGAGRGGLPPRRKGTVPGADGPGGGYYPAV